ncbi:TBC/Rab GTPase activating domain containing protein [Entamoeba histolytica HM-3:IMSS]|uniref:TBC/Rab GTPase activating domain containing protein n=6 Tax=Entamoeba histolytica TaxID=5759 RepID=C4LZI0_ENTH1|nr:TBC/Rab GTPase activating domain containing protein [Entamoeba histolytica HM-1:IMSS]EMD42545.1 TBC/Rab gtpase activating domain containing protein [Entamoeba histolytica KU27]EMS16047.1 TBC/Rab GTPase activating domain containing protein [Entamoeba histolytica HM-3:IMSS]ENY63631.1 TBC/Rab GTPase activating domain containing protein [Entamoeba histolytica HM-1:IMSS-A]GAT94274.1 tbc Rab GTPase activating domain containing protein [Entamoeba histolytica]EAL49462.1 TBC/Rab GTPase activating do|eukprot:XP_654848.1 TBC/Rab GTPase activating domain containing protein [Entamoeba histolytica HM-1:IMSS]
MKKQNQLSRLRTIQLIESDTDNISDNNTVKEKETIENYEIIDPSKMQTSNKQILLPLTNKTITVQNPLKIMSKTETTPPISRTGTIELKESIESNEEDFEDIETFYDCYIKLDICLIYGVMVLCKKRGNYYLNYIPIQFVNKEVGLLNILINKTMTNNFDSYKYSICLTNLSSFYLYESYDSNEIYNFKPISKEDIPEIYPNFEFHGKYAKTTANHLMEELKKIDSLKIVQDNKNDINFIIFHINLERVRTCLLGTISPWERMSRPDLIRQRSSLVLTKHIEGMNALSKKTLKTFMDSDGRISEENMDSLRRTVYYRGCEPDIREFAWLLCIGYYNYRSTTKERNEFNEKKKADYEKIKKIWQEALPEQIENWKFYTSTNSQIDKDVRRTDRNDSKFVDLEGKNCKILKNVLMTYSFFNMRVGYGQGMNDICALLMDICHEESTLFWMFKYVMDFLQPFYFCKGDIIMKALRKNGSILRFVCPQLADYFEQANIDYFFCYKWNALLFKRFFINEDLIRIWDSIFAFPERHLYYFISMCIIKEYSDIIISKQFSLDELFIFIQSLTNKIPVDIIFDADVLYQEFLKTADPLNVQFVYEKFNYKQI